MKCSTCVHREVCRYSEQMKLTESGVTNFIIENSINPKIFSLSEIACELYIPDISLR